MDKLREKIRDYLMESIPKPEVTYGEDADSILSLVRSEFNRQELSGVVAVKDCYCGLIAKTIQLCPVCHNAGLIPREFTIHEVLEILAMLLDGRAKFMPSHLHGSPPYILLPTGERVTIKEGKR